MPKKAASATMADKIKNLKTDGVRIGNVGELDLSVKWVSTGNLSLDHILGGGFPKGRVIELAGKPSSGKTTSALQAAGNLLQAEPGRYVVFFDFERSFDPDYAEALGVDTSSPFFIHMLPHSLEEGFNVFREFLETGEIGMAIFDSIAAMNTEKERSVETGHTLVGEKQKVMHQAMRQVVDPIYDTDCVCIFLNHLQEVISTMPGAPKTYTTPGGTAVKYYASIRTEFKDLKRNKVTAFNDLTQTKEQMELSKEVIAKVTKNKVAKPGREAVLQVRYGQGFSQAYSVYKILSNHDKFAAAGAWITLTDLELAPVDGTVKFNGENQLLSLMETDHVWLDKLAKAAYNLLSNTTVDDANVTTESILDE